MTSNGSSCDCGVMRAGIMTQRNQRIVELFTDPHVGEFVADIMELIDYDMDMDRLHAIQIRRALNRSRRPLSVLFENNHTIIDDIPTAIPVPGPLRRQSADAVRDEFHGSGSADDPIDLS